MPLSARDAAKHTKGTLRLLIDPPNSKLKAMASCTASFALVAMYQ
jgi:hypothetical protein